MVGLNFLLTPAAVSGSSRLGRPRGNSSPAWRTTAWRLRSLTGFQFGQVGVIIDLRQRRRIASGARPASAAARRHADQRLGVSDSENSRPTLFKHLHVDLRAGQAQPSQCRLDRVVYCSSRLFNRIPIRHCRFSNSASCRAVADSRCPCRQARIIQISVSAICWRAAFVAACAALRS